MNDNKPIVIPVSFKNTQEDIELYDWISKHSGKSSFIKDILKRAKLEESDRNRKYL